MQDRLFGIETEYAVSGVSAGGEPIAPGDLAAALVSRAAADLPHLRNLRGPGLFLQSGGRLYMDCGAHPEIATPECLDPWDAVRFVRAGDRIMARLAARVQQECPPGTRVMLFRSNVDYSGGLSTWGCHESYLHRSPLAEVAAELVPHLASRQIFTGAGGFDPTSAGLEFTLSPRAAHITTVQSRDSVARRGIVHTKEESLAGGDFQRLHIIFGESLCSDLALWLKVGATALIIAMVDGGVKPGADVRLSSPLAAIKTFAADPTCRARALLVNGRTASALDIQRHYLRQAESYSRSSFMPAWTDEVCACWRTVLTLLETSPASVSTRLDWAVKHALYIDHARRRGFSWTSLPVWTKRLASVRQRAETNGQMSAPGTEPAMQELWRAAAAEGLNPERLCDVVRLRAELFEIDMRFGQLVPDGIFGALDCAGRLDHRIDRVGEVDIEHAVSCPPRRGRARLRGEAIGRLARQGERYACDWTGIWNREAGRWLDLSDPFQERGHWSATPPRNL